MGLRATLRMRDVRDIDFLRQYEKTLGDEAGSLKLVSSIEKNAHHYLEILSRAVDKAMPEPQTQITWVIPVETNNSSSRKLN